jgi:hypothetical protein
MLGRPKATRLAPDPGGGFRLTVESRIRPRAELGQYRNLAVDLDRSGDPQAFAEAAIDLAASQMTAPNSEAMVESRLDAMAAAEKLEIHRNPLWRLLADTSAVLSAACREVAVNRPQALLRAEALDVLLATVSGDGAGGADGGGPGGGGSPNGFLEGPLGGTPSGPPSLAHLAANVERLVARYRDLPADFGLVLSRLFRERAEKVAAMTTEEASSEAFKAHLGAMGLTEASWRETARTRAVRAVRHDLLLDAVAEAEDLEASDDEVLERLMEVAEDHGLELSEALSGIDRRPIAESILRDKARRLIVASASGRGAGRPTGESAASPGPDMLRPPGQAPPGPNDQAPAPKAPAQKAPPAPAPKDPATETQAPKAPTLQAPATKDPVLP